MPEKICKEIIRTANALVEERGMKRAIKLLEDRLQLRYSCLYQDPDAYNSPYIKLWDRGVDFKGFTSVEKDARGVWILVFECDYTWSKGFGRKRTTYTERVTRGLPFDYPISSETDVAALLS